MALEIVQGILIQRAGVPDVVTTPETFEDLAAAAGLKLSQLADAIPCDLEIFRRIAQGRQPLAADLAERIAAVLGVGVGVVLGVAKYVTPLRGLALWQPGAPDAARGDDFPAVPLAHTAPPVTLPPFTEQLVIWTAGEDVGTGADGAVRLGRNTGRIHQRSNLAIATTPGPVVYDAAREKVWVLGNRGTARFDVATGALDFEATDLSFGQVLSAIYDPFSTRIWFTDGTSILRLDPDTGFNDYIATLSDGVGVCTLRDIASDEAGGLYVTGYRLTGAAPPATGRVIKISSITGAALAVSTGIDLQSPWGIAWDGGNFLLGASCEHDPVGSTPRIWRLPISTMIAAAFAITGVPAIEDPTWVARQHGSWWVTDLLHAGPRLARISDIGVIEQTRTFDATGGRGGRVALGDPWFTWYTDRGMGLVHVMTPSNLSGPELVIDVGGLPDGIVVPPLV